MQHARYELIHKNFVTAKYSRYAEKNEDEN
jgi:hypothetical protein